MKVMVSNYDGLHSVKSISFPILIPLGKLRLFPTYLSAKSLPNSVIKILRQWKSFCGTTSLNSLSQACPSMIFAYLGSRVGMIRPHMLQL